MTTDREDKVCTHFFCCMPVCGLLYPCLKNTTKEAKVVGLGIVPTSVMQLVIIMWWQF